MSNRFKCWWLFIGFAFVASHPRRGAAEEEALFVIVHPSVQVTELNADQLASIFMLSQRMWPGGRAVTPFNYDPNSSLRVRFDRAVLGMNGDEVARFWIDRKIRGGGDVPRKLPTPALMVRVVATLPGAIGYVPANMPTTGTKVVAQVSGNKVFGVGAK